MKTNPRIEVVTPDDELADLLEGLPMSFEPTWTRFHGLGESLSGRDAPPLVRVVDCLCADFTCSRLKTLEEQGAVILCLDGSELDEVDWAHTGVSDFMVRMTNQPALAMPMMAPGFEADENLFIPGLPLDPVETAARLELVVRRAGFDPASEDA